MYGIDQGNQQGKRGLASCPGFERTKRSRLRRILQHEHACDAASGSPLGTSRTAAAAGRHPCIHTRKSPGGPSEGTTPILPSRAKVPGWAAVSCIALFLLLLAVRAWAAEEVLDGIDDPIHGPQLSMDLSETDIQFQSQNTRGNFRSTGGVGVAVASKMTWRLYCQNEGPSDLPGFKLFLLPARTPEDLTRSYPGQPIPLDGEVLVANGNPHPKMAEANNLTLYCEIDPLAPAGTYTGHVQFFWCAGRSQQRFPGRRLRYRVRHDPFVEIAVTPEAMHYDIARPGENFCDGPVKISVRTNTPTARVSLGMEALTNEGGDDISTGHFALGLGESEQTALAQARGNALGTTELWFDCPMGASSRYVMGRADIDLNIPPGQYQGLLQVTASEGL